jgi:hypothetical protein
LSESPFPLGWVPAIGLVSRTPSLRLKSLSGDDEIILKSLYWISAENGAGLAFLSFL